MLILLGVALPPAVVAWLAACGPSVHSVYEGTIRFEHCYRLDLDPNIAPGHREACWRSYSERYHYGQSRDRLEYANRRIRALAAGDTSRPILALDAGGDAEPVSPTEAPLPTSVHAPPPPTAKPAPTVEAGADGADAAGTTGDASAPPPPGTDCADSCLTAWKTCGGSACASLEGGAPDSKVARACASCERDYRRCMQRCFR